MCIIFVPVFAQDQWAVVYLRTDCDTNINDFLELRKWGLPWSGGGGGSVETAKGGEVFFSREELNGDIVGGGIGLSELQLFGEGRGERNGEIRGPEHFLETLIVNAC